MATMIDDQIDYGQLVRNDRVNGRVYYDPEIFRHEIDTHLASGMGLCRT